MQQYGVRDVEKLLGLSRSTIRALIEAGFVAPARGPRNAWLFSFQDLIVLRTARALAHANVPRRRITKSLKELRRHLPETMPLSGLRIGAVADQVVISEGDRRWQAESGQYLLSFDGDPTEGPLRVVEQIRQMQETRTRVPAANASPGASDGTSRGQSGSDDDWFGQAVALERDNIDAAARAYERAIAADPAHLDARVNLGRMLHEAGRLTRALRIYRDAVKACGDDAVLLFNLGVLLDDMDRKGEAVAAYEAALRADPGMADGHYNLALLYEQLAKPQDALRHMSQYRRLTGAKR